MGGLLLAVLLGWQTLSVVSQPINSPNLVITLADDISANEFSSLTDGFPSLNGARTPNFDMMKSKGVSFLTAWSMPICGPTRGSLMTGLYAQITGWFKNAGKPEDENLGVLYGTFPQLAQQQGYQTLIAGKWQMEGEVTPYGFDEACLWQTSDDPNKKKNDFYGDFSGPVNPINGQRSRFWHPFIIANGSMVPTGPKDFGPNVIFDCAMNFISRQVAGGRKFMVYMPMLLTHTDYDFRIDDGKGNKYIPVPEVNKKGKILRQEPGAGSMKRNVEYQDYLMGKLLKHIKRVGVERDTVTFFMGDNGSSLYGKKVVASEYASRVPFVVYGPGRVQRRGNSMELVSTNDIYSTVASLLGAEVSEIPRPHSVDFSKYLLGKSNSIDRKWLYGYLGNKRWIRNDRYIYDGAKVLYRCPTRDERGCVEVTEFNSVTNKLLKRFETILCLLDAGESVNPNSLVQRSSAAQNLKKFRRCK